jgi:hypothetical protein
VAFADQLLIRLLDDAFVGNLLTEIGLTRLFSMSYEFDVGELKELTLAGIKRRQFQMPVFETLRATTMDERLLPNPERWKRDREQPRRGRLSWVDLFLELRLAAKVDAKAAPLKEIVVSDLLETLGNPTNLTQLRNALRARYGDSVVAAAFERLKITSFEEFRRRGARFVQFVSEPPPPFDPADPATARSYALCACLVAEAQLDLTDALRNAKLVRSLLENERQHRELFDGGEVKRPYVLVVLFPESAAQGGGFPGLTPEQVRTRTRELFAAEEMVAHFVAD